MLIFPQGADQPWNANIIQTCGLGNILTEADITILEEKITEVQDDKYISNLSDMSQNFKNSQTGTDIVEQIVGILQCNPEKLMDEHYYSQSFYSAPELPPFLCPYCGKCSLEQFISDNGCPKKKSSSDSTVRFPYLDLSDLDEDNRIDLEDRLVDDTREMILQFASFTAMIRSSLKNLQIPLEDIKCYITNIIR